MPDRRTNRCWSPPAGAGSPTTGCRSGSCGRRAGRCRSTRRSATASAMLESCRRPDLVAEITLQPVRRYGVDAAIFYSDIMVPLQAAGVDLDIVPGRGPGHRPTGPHGRRPRPAPAARSGRRSTTSPRPSRLLVAELGATPLIGFAGAPFTLASYLVEGGPSKDYAATKAMMVGDPALWHELCTPAGRHLGDLPAGAGRGRGRRRSSSSTPGPAAWPPPTTPQHVQPYSARVLAAVAERGVPRIHFGVGTGELLPLMGAGRRRGGRGRLAGAAGRGQPADRPAYAVQGNLDPALLRAPWPVLAERVRAVLRSGAAAPGHVFNLGHGVPPDADPDVLARIVDLVQPRAELRARGPRGRRRRDPGRRRRRRDHRAERGPAAGLGRLRGHRARGRRRAAAASWPRSSSTGSGSTAGPSRCWPAGPRRVDLIAELGSGRPARAPDRAPSPGC